MAEVNGSDARPVVAVIGAGIMGSAMARNLAAAGLENLHVLAGGVTAWEAAGAPLTRGTKTWELERQVLKTRW